MFKSTSSKANLMGAADDAWDDTELIKAYDKAVKSWKRTRTSETTGEVKETAGPGPWTEVNENSENQPTEDDDYYEEDEEYGDGYQQQDYPPQQYPTYQGNYSHPGTSMPHLRFPVPPLPQSLSRDGAFDFGRGELPALLMSWYMAGYQAGFYDAKQEFSASTSVTNCKTVKKEPGHSKIQHN